MNQFQTQNKKQIKKTVINDPTMPFYVFQQNINTLCIKATLGLGKTITLYDFLKYKLNKDYQSCLIISFRKSLCRKYNKELNGFIMYDKIKTKTIDVNEHPYVICQIDSLKRIRGQYNLVIFDEMTYTTSHIVSSVSEKKRVHDALTQILYDNNHIIVLDALLNDDYINYISGFGRNIEYIENKYSIHSDKKLFNYGTNKTQLLDEIKQSIKKNENIVIVTNNRKFLGFVDTCIVNNFKNIKKKFITKDDVDYDMDNWDKLQVLGYTPSIVAGISYTKKHFNKVFGIFCNTSSTADLSLQQLFRIRDISSNEFHLCCDVTGKNDYPESIEDIKKMITEEDKCLVNQLDNISIDYLKNDIKEDDYFRLFSIYQQNRFRSCNNYMKELLYLLKQQGITNVVNITKFDEYNKKLYNLQRKEYNQNVKEEEAVRTANSLDITDEEEEEIKNKENISIEEKFMLRKHKNKKIFKINDITKEELLKYEKHGKKAWNLAYIYGYEDYHNQLLKRILYNEKKNGIDDNTVRLGRDRKYEKMLLCDHIFKYMGFIGPLDNNKIKIDKIKFKEYIQKYHTIFESYFKINKLDEKIFDDVKWYSKCKQYLNSKLKSVYGLSIVEDKKTKLQYINGIGFWNDRITYKNPLIIDEIKEKEIKMFDKIDEDLRYNDIVNDVLTLSLDEINAKYDKENYNQGYEPIVESDNIQYYDNINTYNTNYESDGPHNVNQEHNFNICNKNPINKFNAFKQWQKNKNIIDNNNVFGDELI